MNELQLYILASNQVLVLKSGMELTRMAKVARQQFKQMVGLPKKATHLQVLFALGAVFAQNGKRDYFFEKMCLLMYTNVLW